MPEPHLTLPPSNKSSEGEETYYLVPAKQQGPSEFISADYISFLVSKAPLILGVGLMCGLVALVGSYFVKPRFRADALLVSVSSSHALGAGGLAAAFGSVNPLAALLPSVSSEQATALAILESRVLIEGFISDNKLLDELFPDKWDPASNAWLGEKVPTLRDGFEVFRAIYRVQERKKSGLIEVSIVWTSPQTAADWITALIARANQHLKADALSESEKRLAFLQEELGRTSSTELRQSLFSLIEAELNRVMLAKGNDEFAFKVIDPPVVNQRKVSPARRQWALAGSIIGALFCVGLLTAFRLRQQSRKHPNIP